MRADPRGPIKVAVDVRPGADLTLVELSCGHVAKFVTHFHYKIGNEYRCVDCLKMESQDDNAL